MNKAIIKKYANLAIRKGVNLQKGQTLLIQADVDAVEMTRACVEEAYAAGAKEVVVFYQDDMNRRQTYLHADEETLCNVREWQVHSKLDYLKEGACILHIISELPGVFKDVEVHL